MRRDQIVRLLFFTIFLFSSGLRFSLALVNREANDDHLEVTRMIMQEKRLPGIDDCLECFHPKLFHSMLAYIFDTSGIAVENITSQTVLAQILNALLGTLLILVVWIFLRSLTVPYDWLAVIAFALIAFNPSLIGINAQATNDSMAILFSTLAVYFIWLFLRRDKSIYLLACILFTSLGIATKTNIFITAFAILFALFVKAFIKKERRMLYSAALFLPGILVLSFLNPLTQYQANSQQYGSVVGMNLPKQPFPALFEPSYVARPGIISIQDGIFTFKARSLFEYPRLTNEIGDYPAHRTSLWTQLYARAHSVHFDNWPESWSTEDPQGFWLTRFIYILAFVPTAMLLIGSAIKGFELLRAFQNRSATAIDRADYGLFEVLFWGYIAFIVLYSLQFRDFSVMKAIFIYPALLSFPVMFIKSGVMIHHAFNKSIYFPIFLSSMTVFLVVLYCFDIYTMITHLYSLL